MGRQKVNPASNWEVISFDEPLKIPDFYDISRAQDAARRRASRIPSGREARINGFLRRVNGLFVPHSGTENTAIIVMPEHKLTQDAEAARERVREKYQDSDVPSRKVDLWAHFAGNNARRGLLHKYQAFLNESSTNAARIGIRLGQFGGQIVREAFAYDLDYRMDPKAHTNRGDVLAYNSVLKYYVDLEAFTGKHPEVINEVTLRRKWPQLRHTHKYRERMERAHAELDPLAEHLFAERVDEAYWSHYSRFRFWADVDNRYRAYMRGQYQSYNAAAHSQSLILPMSAYESTPEYMGLEVE